MLILSIDSFKYVLNSREKNQNLKLNKEFKLSYQNKEFLDNEF